MPDADLVRAIERQKQLAWWLDDRFRIPFTRWRLGVDGVIGLVPGIGDAATTLIALYIVLEARRLGVPPGKLVRMGMNIGVDALMGVVPLVGDLADAGFKANRRNVRILIDHLEEQAETTDAEQTNQPA
jgi:hypothetical protein